MVLRDGDDDVPISNSPLRPCWGPSEPEVAEEKLFFVPYRLWSEVTKSLGESIDVNGVLYTAESLKDAGISGDEIVIVINLRSVERSYHNKSGCPGGRAYALVADSMFLRALKWHNDMKGLEGLLAAEDNREDPFALAMKLFFSSETNSLLAKACEKGNESGAFSRARHIFCTDSGRLNIWDFSGQITQFLRHDKVDPALDSAQLNKKKEELASEKSIINRGSVERIGVSDHDPPCTRVGYNSRLGLTGLFNLGNTCFMNSAIQCLVHTPKLVGYFLGDFRRDKNSENLLDTTGGLASAFGDLLSKLWSAGAIVVNPAEFHSKLNAIPSEFCDYKQHDSHEFLTFLLDKLHEDLNRAKCIPYTEAKDAEGRPSDEVTDEHWRNHLACNDSIIVNECQGQYRSTLACAVCNNMSVTFDPFMVLSLSLPSTTKRSMTLTVLGGDGTAPRSEETVSVPMHGTLGDLRQALISECSLRDNETLFIAEILAYCHYHFFKSSDKIEDVRNIDTLVAYVLPGGTEESPLVAFTHEQRNKWFKSPFGIPLISRASNLSKGSDIRDLFLNLVNPFLMPVEENAVSNGLLYDESSRSDLEFYWLEDHKNVDSKSKIQMDEPVSILASSGIICVFVSWPEEMAKLCDPCFVRKLPKISLQIQPQESISLYECLEAFLEKELLGPENAWYCSDCKNNQLAFKKLDLWRLPEILIIHLKRFSYSRVEEKLETLVDFPVDDLNLTGYVAHKSSPQLSCRYRLYAVSSHYGGGLDRGHYKAFAKVQHGDENMWYVFDDKDVSLAGSEKDIKASAYMLFYERVSDTPAPVSVAAGRSRRTIRPNPRYADYVMQ